MTGPSNDRSLYQAFSGLRRDEREAAPDLRALLAAARHEGPCGRLRWPLVAAPIGVAMALALLLMSPPWRGAPPLSPAQAAMGPWYRSTDVLLETPGIELLRELPVFESARTDPERPFDEDPQPEGPMEKRSDLTRRFLT